MSDGLTAPVAPDSDAHPRLTRAQRRAQERVDEHRPVVPASTALQASLGAAMAAAVAVAADTHVLAITAVVALLGLAIALGWSYLLAAPSPRGTFVVILLGSLACVVAATVSDTDPLLRWLPSALAGTLLAAFAHQLVRSDGRSRLTESVATSVSAVAVVASGACMIPLVYLPPLVWLVAAGMGGVLASIVAELAARWDRVKPLVVLLAIILGAGAGALVSMGDPELPLARLALLGAGSAALSHVIRRALSVVPAALTYKRGVWAIAAAGVLFPGVVVYVVARLLVS